MGEAGPVPCNTYAKPILKLLREPKTIIIYDGGYVPTIEFFVPTVDNWFN